jgi:hypothetical protein
MTRLKVCLDTLMAVYISILSNTYQISQLVCTRTVKEHSKPDV